MSRLEQLQAFLAESPGDPFLLFAIAKEYESLSQPREALARYEEIRKNSPDYVGVYYHLGKLLETLEKPDEAVQAYEEGMEIARRLGDRHSLGELAGARDLIAG